MKRRVFWVVLDSFGIGEAPDAADFGDVGSSTLGSLLGSPKLKIPNLTKLGLLNIEGVKSTARCDAPVGCFARMQEVSRGKDTTTGHWEMAGVVSKDPMPVFPNGFDENVLQALEKATGRGILCNKPYSGTKVIADYGKEHMQTGKLIVYTSADSVLQIAAHEDVIPVDELYEICGKAREIMTGPYAVGRVIARPFIGDPEHGFTRTSRRHDFSVKPPRKTVLDYLLENGKTVIGIGKIYDIFAGMGVGEMTRTAGNTEGIARTLEIADRDFDGLCFTNLVDTDMLYGHRRDIDGYAAAISEFDDCLPALMQKMKPEDMLVITADHGCDPGFMKTTDHTREYVPLLFFGGCCRQGVDLGTRKNFGAAGATIAEALGVPADIEGESFWPLIQK